MNKIEKFYYEWSENHDESVELKEKQKELEEFLEKVIEAEQFNSMDALIMEYVIIASTEAFKGGFQEATKIWRECNND